MVLIKGYHQRTSSDGRKFIVLQLEGNLQVQHSQNGNLYATVPKCTIATNFDEETAKSFVGTTLPGTIERISCEPYLFTNPQTGETVTLDYKFTYRSSESSGKEKEDVITMSREVSVE